MAVVQEARLAADCSAAQQVAAELRGERDVLAASVRQLEAEVHGLRQQLREEQQHGRAAAGVAERHQGQAARAAARVLEVEEELREVGLAGRLANWVAWRAFLCFQRMYRSRYCAPF